jgi:hypothetical protein
MVAFLLFSNFILFFCYYHILMVIKGVIVSMHSYNVLWSNSSLLLVLAPYLFFTTLCISICLNLLYSSKFFQALDSAYFYSIRYYHILCSCCEGQIPSLVCYIIRLMCTPPLWLVHRPLYISCGSGVIISNRGGDLMTSNALISAGSELTLILTLQRKNLKSTVELGTPNHCFLRYPRRSCSG